MSTTVLAQDISLEYKLLEGRGCISFLLSFFFFFLISTSPASNYYVTPRHEHWSIHSISLTWESKCFKPHRKVKDKAARNLPPAPALCRLHSGIWWNTDNFPDYLWAFGQLSNCGLCRALVILNLNLGETAQFTRWWVWSHFSGQQLQQ